MNKLLFLTGICCCLGAYCSEYTIDPEEDLILLVYTNATSTYYGEFVRKFRILVYQALN